MFTGIVECMGTLAAVEEHGEARRLRVAVNDPDFLRDAVPGESIAVDGTCLTVTALEAGWFAVDAVEETLRRTTLGGKAADDALNLERALRVNDRLGGHIVQGHVDTTGVITAVREEGTGWWVTFQPPHETMRYIVEKGSICVDGISLTVANVAYSRFSIAIIPHTREVTTAGEWREGRKVNLEFDVLAKYVERLTQWAMGGQGAEAVVS